MVGSTADGLEDQTNILNVFTGFNICFLVLFCFPLATSILTLVVLLKKRIRDAFAFFGTELAILTMAVIGFCAASEIVFITSLSGSSDPSTAIFVNGFFGVFQWTLLALINWNVAVICVLQCKDDGPNFPTSSALFFFVLLIIFGAVTLVLKGVNLAMTSPFRMALPDPNAIDLIWPTYIVVILLPLLTTLVSAIFLFLKVRKDSRHKTVHNKIALILAVVFIIVNVCWIPVMIVDYLIMSNSVTASYGLALFAMILSNLISITAVLSLIFIFTKVSNEFRVEVFALVRCTQAVHSDILLNPNDRQPSYNE